MTRKHKQLEVPGTEPVELYPDVREKLDAWLVAQEDAAEARRAVSNAHDVLLDAIAEAKIPYYVYDVAGKRKRVFPTATPKLKTETVGAAGGGENEERRGRPWDARIAGEEADEVAPDDKVEHRKVRRGTVPASEIDPFAATRAMLDEAQNGGAV